MDVLENLLHQAINPSNQQYNSDTIKTIVKLIDSDPNSVPVTLRLIAHRFQSPQEREALNALCLLDILASQCGTFFLSELGKFKFLNEMIKVLSPRYLGDQSTVAVKRKCIQLIYKWQRDYSSKEPKFADAYNMLCKQGFINPDELIKDGNATEAHISKSNREPNIFDRSSQSKKLAGLLRSKNPNDVAEANRIIKSILEEDQKRMEKVIQRSTEMESLKNSTMLLEELTKTLSRGNASEAELDLMNELGQNIRKSRSLLYNFSLTHEENDIETLSEIAHICDHASTVLNAYELQLNRPNGTVAEFCRSKSADQRIPMVDDLLSQDLKQLGLDEDLIDSSRATSNPLSLGTQAESPVLGDVLPTTSSCSKYDELADIFSNLPSASPSASVLANLTPVSAFAPSKQPVLSHVARTTTTTSSPKPSVPTTSISAMFNDLDTIGRRMLGLNTPVTASQSAQIVPDSTPTDLLSTSPADACSTMPDVTSSEPVDLANFDVPLSIIQPHGSFKRPFIVYPCALPSDPGVQLALHYTSNQPGPDILVFVAVTTNHGSSTITDLHVRFGVVKPLHIRQLPPSGHSLSAYSPFLPVSTVNQVILIHDPLRKPELAIKFQLSFNENDDPVLESGEIHVPVVPS